MLITEAFVSYWAQKVGLEPSVLACFTAIESAFDPSRVRYEPRWPYLLTPELFAKKLFITVDSEIQLQKFSWGPVQIMGTVAREHGFEGHIPSLVYPEIGMQYGCLEILDVIKKHGLTTDAVSAYNRGSPKQGPDGRYLNQGYVNRFLSEWDHRGHRLEGTKLVF